MTTGDGIPSFDAVGSAARRTLYKIGFGDSPNPWPWSVVIAAARRVRRRRVATGVVAIAAVLTGAGAASAVVASRQTGDRPKPLTTATSAATTTTAVTPTAPERPPDVSAPLPAETPQPTGAEPTTSTTEPVLQPYDGEVSWTAETTTDTPQVMAGGDIVLHTVMTNTGTRSFQTLGYGSLGVACAQLPSDPPARDDVRIGTFLDFVVLQPGEVHTFTVTLTAPDYVGRMTCGVGLGYHGDAFAAGPTYGPADAILDILPAPASTTTPEPTTTSTTTASA